MADEDKDERVNRELHELLNELRVIIPGAQVLFGFLLGVAFTQRINDVTTFQKNLYFATLVITAGATAMLIAPSAYHRLNFRSGTYNKERMLFTAGRLAIASLVLVSAAVSASVFLVGDMLYESAWVGLAGAGTAAWFVWFWFGLPLSRRGRSARD